ncbi:MAG: thiolase family protein [Acidimicrobiales bacterium]|nr:thiolase family protein [Acidimicrobiales bacterium]
MRSAVIVDAVRTPLGRRRGALGGWNPAELVAEVLVALQKRTDLDPALVDDVIMGCVTQVGPQSSNIARNAVLAAGWPVEVPGTTVDRQCGSSQQSIHFAAQAIVSGFCDVIVAAGVELMTSVPMFSNAGGDLLTAYPPAMHARFAQYEHLGGKGLVAQGISAEMVAEQWKLSREDLDRFSLRSHERAAAARDSGRFGGEIVPVVERKLDLETGASHETGQELTNDEGIRDTSLEALAGLKPVFLPEGKVTAGNSSQITDGAAALLIMEESMASRLGMRPLARVSEMALAATDPVIMLTAPIPATQKVLERAGLGVDDVDLYEVNEAFASVPLAWQAELSVDPERVNVNGGAVALGHPLGASGARLMTTLVHELARRGSRYGLQTMCEGGGMANATLVESL